MLSILSVNNAGKSPRKKFKKVTTNVLMKQMHFWFYGLYTENFINLECCRGRKRNLLERKTRKRKRIEKRASGWRRKQRKSLNNPRLPLIEPLISKVSFESIVCDCFNFKE